MLSLGNIKNVLQTGINKATKIKILYSGDFSFLNTILK